MGMQEPPFDIHLLAAVWVRAFWLEQLKQAARQLQEQADELREKASGLG